MEKKKINGTNTNIDRVHLTPDNAESFMGGMIPNVGITLQEQLDYLKSRPYTGTITRVHKGNFAKEGMSFLVVKIKTTFLGIGRVFTNARQFDTKDLEDQGVRNLLFDKLYEHLRKTYPNAQLPE